MTTSSPLHNSRFRISSLHRSQLRVRPNLRNAASAARGAAVAGCIAVIAGYVSGYTRSAPEPLAVSDWCWLHYRFAPPGALADDTGPHSITDAALWDKWLGSTVDAPPDRHDAHAAQRRLIDDFIESGNWSSAARQSYRASAQTEPTPATICETVGARIAVGNDGSVPSGWDERFLDPNDPAHSELATSAGVDR